MNKWDKLFEECLETMDFSLIKHQSNQYDGIWSLIDRQGANLGDIESDRFNTAAEIIERLEIYIKDYFFDDLEEELEAYNVDLENREMPWSAMDWVKLRADKEFHDKNSDFFDLHSWELDVLDMIARHIDEVNLENVFYEEEE